MSANDIPPSVSRKKRSCGYFEEFDGDPTASYGFPKVSNLFENNVAANVSSILQKKSDVSRAVDMSRHSIEKTTTPSGTTAMSIVKRPKVPVSQAVAVVSAQKMVGTSIFHPSREESVSDIATISHNKGIANVSKKKSVSPFADENIRDAEYKELVDDIVSGDLKSNGFRSKKSGRNINVTRQKPEPASMQAISLKKRQTVSQLAQKAPVKHWGDDTLGKIDNTVDVANGTLNYIGSTIKKGMQRQAREIANDISYELETNRQARDTRDEYYGKQKEIVRATKRFNKIEKAKTDDIYYANTNIIDRTVDRAKTTQKVGNKIIKETAPVVIGGLKAIDATATAFGNSTVGKNINRNADVEYAHLRSVGKRACGSIVGVGNRRTLNAGSLVKQYGTTNTTQYNTPVATSSSNPYGIVARFEKGLGGRFELHYYYNNRRVTHDQVNHVLTKRQIKQLRSCNKIISTYFSKS